MSQTLGDRLTAAQSPVTDRESAMSCFVDLNMYGVRNLDMSIRFSLKFRPSERFQEMSQIKAEISLGTNVK